MTKLTTAPEACSVNKHVMARGSFLCARAFSAHEGCVFMSNTARQLQWCLAMSPTWTNYCHSNEFHSKLTWIFLDSLPVWRLFHFTFAFKFFAFCCPSLCCFCFDLGGAHSSCHSFAQSCDMKPGSHSLRYQAIPVSLIQRCLGSRVKCFLLCVAVFFKRRCLKFVWINDKCN